MDYKYVVYGDSIAFGYGNNNKSWFDLLFYNEKNLKSAQNGETISGVLNKIKGDVYSYDVLYIAIGINDLLSSSMVSQINVLPLINQYEEILKIAKLKAKEVVVLSVLPVREDEFPSQNWLDEDMWCFNSDIINFNENVRLLCNKYNVQFFDVYNKFILYDLNDLYIDAVHLNKLGQEKVACLLDI